MEPIRSIGVSCRRAWSYSLAIVVLLAGGVAAVDAQTAPTAPPAMPANAAPAVMDGLMPSGSAPADGSVGQQLRALEETNRLLRQRLDELSQKYDLLSSLLQRPATDSSGLQLAVQQQPADSGSAPSGSGRSAPSGSAGTTTPPAGRQEGSATAPIGGGTSSIGRREGRGGAPLTISVTPTERPATYSGGLRTTASRTPGGFFTPVEPREEPYKPDMEPVKRKVEAGFAEGLYFDSSDKYFSLVFHNLTQLDLRIFDPTGDPLHDGFIIPRQRWYFQGHASPYVNYYTVINRGYGTLDVLDAWLDFNFDPEKLQLRVGRMKTPYTYEYIKISESDLIAPERSLFVGNLAPNRAEGMMFHGRLCDRRIEYFAGVFNSLRRAFEPLNDGKDFVSFINTKPFLLSDCDCLKQLNLGGSFSFSRNRNPVQPFEFRTASDQSNASGADNVSPVFLRFRDNAFANGIRDLWSGDIAYYYKSFGLLAGYQGGFQEFSLVPKSIGTSSTAIIGVGSPFHTTVPYNGYSVAAFYFLTGEEITRRVYLLEPVRPFGVYNGRLNPGAIEAYARYAYLYIGSNIFSGGLADPTLWTNQAGATDIGINWYMTNYTKITFDWQHAMYGAPVQVAPTAFTKHEDLYWLRFQLFF